MHITEGILERNCKTIIHRVSQKKACGLCGDRICIRVAVCSFVRTNYRPRTPGATAPKVEDLSTGLQVAIEEFHSAMSVADDLMDELCSGLAEFINTNFQNVENLPWTKSRSPWRLAMDVTGKYKPLYDFLLKKREDGYTRWSATFSMVEAVLGSRLPPFARKHREFWTNLDHPVGRASTAWCRAGWKASKVNMRAEVVVFAAKDS